MSEREALTVRLRAGLLAQLRKHKLRDESLNDLIIKALEREVRYRQGLAAHYRIVEDCVSKSKVKSQKSVMETQLVSSP